MKLNKQTQIFEGELTNGKSFILDLIKRGESWLFGVKVEGKPSFFTCSNDFEEKLSSEITLKLSQQLEDLGIPGEDVNHFINQLVKLV